ncbi:MAG: glycosyl-4,4'-diaponeurosporenoate acyltransferase [Acidobacteriota bacterium]
MSGLVWAANLLGWPAIHLSVSSVFLRLPSPWFAEDSWLTAPRRWERDGCFYRDRFAIRRWKALLPDGAPWLGGFAKKELRSRDRVYLTRFLLETRRAEVAHWCMLCCAPVFFFWNPPWACCVMTVYALAANLPCVVAQRYNRLVLARATAAVRRCEVRP